MAAPVHQIFPPGAGGQDKASGGNAFIQRAAGAVKQNLLRPSGQYALQQAHGTRAAHQGVEDPYPPPLPAERVDGDFPPSAQNGGRLCRADLLQKPEGAILNVIMTVSGKFSTG